MRKLALTLATVAAFLLPIGGIVNAGHHHPGHTVTSNAIDWD